MTIGALGFLSPWLLAGLLALPIIYWLLRAVPPRPQQIEFPATRILVGIENRERTPHKTPWWLVLLRMIAAGLVILALAEPVLNPNREQGLKGNGPVVIVVDNGWSAATRWSERVRLIERYINEAEAAGRPVLVAGTALAAKAQTFKIEPPRSARSTAAALQPQPFEPSRKDVASRIRAALGPTVPAGVSVVWLGDGIDHSDEARAFAEALVSIAGGASSVSLVETAAGDEALGVLAGVSANGRLEATVIRASGGPRSGYVYAFSGRGQRLGEVPFRFSGSESRTSIIFDLPLEIRNQVTRLEVASERSAGGVHLLDARSQWHRVGLVSGESREQAQPLLAPLYYIQKALQPYSEIVPTKDANLTTAVDLLLKRNVSVMILADIGTISGDLRPRVEEFVRKGGILLRFAGPRLERGGDDLIPVELRTGGLTRGGALSWSKPEPLANFSDDSLFVGLPVPEDVQVSRQVLADPAKLGPEVKIWARLKDGTPLVTAKKLGEGQLVLFHVTANSEWSNLPMSGLFVEMLRRLATLGTMSSLGTGDADVADQSRALGGVGSDVLAPSQVLDGFGVLRAPPPTAQAIAMKSLASMRPSLDHPPGYYGPQGVPRAFNLIGPKTELKPLSGLPSGIERRAYEGSTQRLLKPDLLTVALLLLLIDVIIVVLMQMGNFWNRRTATGATAALAIVATLTGGLALGAITASPAGAQVLNQSPRPPGSPPPRSRDEQVAIMATGKVSFAYVITGDRTVDDTSRAGLKGLSRMLAVRTAVEPGEPFGVNIATDEIAFFPILYWPVLPTAESLPQTILAKIDAYMKQGGMIIFDTRDHGTGMPMSLAMQRGGTALQKLLGNLDIPRLEPVPEGHVLTKSFYLIRTFPGRYDGGQLWVEAESVEAVASPSRKARRVDGVTSILITSNDFAAAWAVDDRLQPMFPVVPGGDAQRELAIRVGINIAMYALTGNYKADQVHVPMLLERLGTSN